MHREPRTAFRQACVDPRASSGVELTVDNFAALYYTDSFQLSGAMAGVVASMFGMMNLFARALGGGNKLSDTAVESC